MTRRAALISVSLTAAAAGVLVLALAGRDGAEATVRPVDDAAERARIGTAALALVDFPAERVGYDIRFEPGRPSVRADVDRTSKTIRVFLRDGDAPQLVAHDIAHELGHAYDAVGMSDADRRAYLARRGVPAAAWEPGGASDYAVGAGDFAEVFALCHAASPDFRSELAPRPEAPCELLPAGAL